MLSNLRRSNNPAFRLITWCSLYVFYFNMLICSILAYQNRPVRPVEQKQHTLSTMVNAFLDFLVSEAHAADEKEGDVTPDETEPTGKISAIRDGGGVDGGSGGVSSFMGAYTYSHPIKVPPGRGGLTPALALNYSSQGTNGPFGVGWSMSVGSIERSTKHAAPQYTDDDTFVITLKGVSIPLVMEDGEYRLKYEGLFLRIVKNSNDTWQATDKEGTQYYFGLTSDSKLDGIGGTFRWHLDRIQDANDNYMDFSYWKDHANGGAVYLERIDYTGHINGQQPYNSVEFVREANPRPDIQTSYATYFKVVTAYRIAAIDVKADQERVRAYQLGYSSTLNEPLQTSYLETIQLYGSDAAISSDGLVSGPTSIAAMSAEYTGVLGSFNDHFVEAQGAGFPGRDETFAMGDFTGDGRTDFVTVPKIGEATHWQLYRSEGDHFTLAAEGTAPLRLTTIHVGDFNGDGFADMLVHNGSTSAPESKLFLSNGNGFEEPIDAPAWVKDQDCPYLGDFNGDGRTDLLLKYETWAEACSGGEIGPVLCIKAKGWKLYLADGAGNLVYQNKDEKFCSNNYECTRMQNGFHNTPFVIGDFNGDGKADFLLRTDMFLLPADWAIYLSTGTDFVEARRVEESGVGLDRNARVYPADFNGDGKTDLFITSAKSDGWNGYKILLSTGDAFVLSDSGSEPSWNDDVYLSDYNGDGRTDLLFAANYKYSSGVVQTGYQLFHSTGSRLERSAASSATGFGSRYHPGDFNGDGMTDFLISSTRKPDILDGYRQFNAQVLESSGYIFFDTPHLIRSITNGLGASVSVTYRPSSAWPKDVDGDGDYHYMPMNIPTVASITENDVRTTLTYEGGYFDPQKKEFRGFRKCTATNEVSGVQTTTYFHQSQEFQGRIESSLTRDKFGHRVIGTENKFNGIKYFGEGKGYSRIFVYAQKSTVTKYDDDDEVLSTITTEYSYEEDGYCYGNLVTEDKKIYNHKTGDSYTRFVRTEYANKDLSKWILGKPTNIRIDVSDPGAGGDDPSTAALRETEMVYHPDRPWLLEEQREVHWEDGIKHLVTTSYFYDQYGNNTLVVDPNGAGTQIDYSESNGKFPNCTTNALGHANTYGCTTHRVFDPRFGGVLEATNVNDQTIVSHYDTLGRLDDVTYPDGSVKDYTYHIEPGNHYMTVAASQAPTATTYYDNQGRKVMDRIVGSDGTTIIKETLYDARGRLWKQSLPYGPSDTPQWTVFTYDHRDRIERQDNPDGTYRTMAYDDFKITTTDEKIIERTIAKDSLGRLVRVDEPTGGFTRYAYDLFDNLVWVEGPLKNQTHITYDDLGRKIAMDDPYMGQWKYDYDDAGNLVWQKDGEQRIVDIAYDPLNRISSKTYQDTGRQIEYTYDEARTGQNGEQYFNTGALTTLTATEPNGGLYNTITYNYDRMGRNVHDTRTINGVSYATQRTFDLAGRLDTMAYPDQATTVDYDYHPMGYLHKVDRVASDNTRTTIAEYGGYNVMGQIGSVTYGNGVTTAYDYHDGNYRLKTLETWAFDTVGAGVKVQDLTYGFDDLGNIETITDHANGADHLFTYDDVNRLTSATVTCSYDPDRAYAQAYTYDLAGNMTGKSGKGAFVVKDWQDEYKHIRPTSIAYAQVHASVGQRDVTYNQDNMPTEMTFKGQSSQLFYDGEGNRVRKASSAGSTIYVGGLMEIRGGQTIIHIHAAGQRIASVRGGQTYYAHGDHLGSSALVTNDSGVVVEEIGYLPYGATLFRKAYEGGVWTSVYRFTGQEYDAEFELYNYNARLYDPVLGRFITADTIVPDWTNPQSLNRYAYCLNNPLKYVDPSGHTGIETAIIVGAIIGALMGAYNASMNGGDVIGGMFHGAIVGGLSAAVSGALFYGAGDLIYATGMGNTAQMAVHAAAGAISGAANAAMTGGDIWHGALIGAVSAGIAKGAGIENLEGRMALGAASGGAAAALAGEDFAEGAFQGAWTAAIAYLCNRLMHQLVVKLLTGGPRVNLPSNDVESHYNIFGHVAISIGDEVYSYGTNCVGGGLDGKDWGVSASDYVDVQSNFRTMHETQLTLSAEQTDLLLSHLRSNVPNISNYSKYSYTCATVLGNALSDIGYFRYNDTFTTPASLYNHVRLKESIANR